VFLLDYAISTEHLKGKETVPAFAQGSINMMKNPEMDISFFRGYKSIFESFPVVLLAWETFSRK